MFKNLFSNPVAIREMRQMVRNKFVATGLILYLFVLLGAVMISVLSQTDSSSTVSIAGRGIGQGVATTVCFILGAMMVVAIPLFTGIRMTIEKGAESMDLQFATTLRPAQFVDGKISSAFILLMLFTSASLPFFMLAYILRGVDLNQTLISVGFLAMFSVLFFYLAVLIGSMNISKAFRFILLAIAVILVTFFPSLNMIFGELHMEWYEFVYMLVCAASLCMILRAAAMAHFSPSSSGGQAPLRITVAITWMLLGAAAIIFSIIEKKQGYLTSWFVIMLVILMFMLIGAVSLPPGVSRRVVSSTSPRLRPLRFITSSGAEGGVCLTLLLMALTVAVFSFVGFILKFSDMDIDFGNVSIFIFLTAYPAAYLITMRLIWHAGLKRFTNRKLVGLFALIWLALGCSLPYLFTIGQNPEIAEYWPGNIAAAIDAANKLDFYPTILHKKQVKFAEMIDLLSVIKFHLWTAGIWLSLVLIIYIPFMIKTYRQFKKSPIDDR